MRTKGLGWVTAVSFAALLPGVALLPGCLAPPEPLVASAPNLKIVTLSVKGMT